MGALQLKSKGRAGQQSSGISDKINTNLEAKFPRNLSEEETTHKFFSLPIGEDRKKFRWQPREG
jgi:hypothetical protein